MRLVSGSGPPGIESIDFRVIYMSANGPVVITERGDVFKLPDKSFELPVMGTFEIGGGRSTRGGTIST